MLKVWGTLLSQGILHLLSRGGKFEQEEVFTQMKAMTADSLKADGKRMETAPLSVKGEGQRLLRPAPWHLLVSVQAGDSTMWAGGAGGCSLALTEGTSVLCHLNGRTSPECQCSPPYAFGSNSVLGLRNKQHIQRPRQPWQGSRYLQAACHFSQCPQVH